jgi:hypothetical protein
MAPYPYWAPLDGDIGLVTDLDCPREALDPFVAAGWRVEVAAGKQLHELTVDPVG